MNTGAVAPPDPLRLAFCPACDYDLAGLPVDGLCPECGRAYDQAYVVLRGRPAVDGFDRLRPAGRRIWGAVAWVAAILAGGWMWLHSTGPFVPVMCGLLAASWLWQWMASFSSPRPGEVLVWLSPVGMGQQRVGDPTSCAGRLQWLAPWGAAAVGAMFIVVGGPDASGVAPSLLLMPVLAGLAWWARPRPVVPADGVRPPLYAWDSFADVRLDLRGGRQLLLGRHDNWYARRQRTVAIDLHVSPETLQALQAWLRDCRARRAPIR